MIKRYQKMRVSRQRKNWQENIDITGSRKITVYTTLENTALKKKNCKSAKT